MKDATSAYLDKARELLDQANTMFDTGLYEPAGRTAYLAGFHAAKRFCLRPAAASTKATAACRANLPAW